MAGQGQTHVSKCGLQNSTTPNETVEGNGADANISIRRLILFLLTLQRQLTFASTATRDPDYDLRVRRKAGAYHCFVLQQIQ